MVKELRLNLANAHALYIKAMDEGNTEAAAKAKEEYNAIMNDIHTRRSYGWVGGQGL